MSDIPRHPAKWSQEALNCIRQYLPESGIFCDPFGGVGRTHELATDDIETVVVELEPLWAAAHPKTIVGNALCLPFAHQAFDGVITSPTFGSRMADSHVAKDDSVRNTYTHSYGSRLHKDNSGTLNWGKAYKEFHQKAIIELVRVCKPGSLFFLNMKDHIRKGTVVGVTDWWIEAMEAEHWEFQSQHKIYPPGLKFGANYDARVGFETINIFKLAV